jgi:hypothetical protein
MKRILSWTNHGIVDYLAILVLAAAPSALKFSTTAAIWCYVFAGILLVTSLFTAYSLGVVKKVSFTIHGLVDFYLSIGILVAGGFFFRGTDRFVTVSIGAIMLLAFLLTDYSEPLAMRRTSRKTA